MLTKSKSGLAIVLLLALSLTSCKKNEPVQEPVVAPEVATQSALLATVADDEKASADPSKRHNPGSKTEPNSSVIIVEMNTKGRGAAFLAQVGNKTRVVHNDKRGSLYKSIETFSLTISPDGQRVAYAAQSDGDQWNYVIDGREYGPFAETGKPSFSPDSRLIAYEGRVGEKWRVYCGENKSIEAVSLFHRPVFNSRGDKLFWIENTTDNKLFNYVISDVGFKKITKKVYNSTAYVTSSDNNVVAVIENEGNKQRVIAFDIDKPDDVRKGVLYDEIRDLSISNDGKSIAYYAAKDNRPYVVFNGKEELLPEGDYPGPPVIRPDNKAVGIIVSKDGKADVYQAFTGSAIKLFRYTECADLAFSKDSGNLAYVAIKDSRFLIIANDNEGPQFDRVVSPHYSPDGKFLVYRARQNGKRFVVVADAASGKVIKEHPSYDRVFETAFTGDGKSVAYGVINGNKIMWKVEKLQ